MKVLFIYLDAFSIIGGIETFNRAFLKAADELDKEELIQFKTLSLYDSEPDERYIRESLYSGSSGKVPGFCLKSIYEAFTSDLIILGHINLAPLGFIIKKITGKKVFLITHGTDVWYRLPKIKEMMLQQADGILSVSRFTKEKLIDVHKIEPSNIEIFYNTLDPYFEISDNFDKPGRLLDKLEIDKSCKILLTVARLSSEEKYKGYDNVIRALPRVIEESPETKYIIVGGGDDREVQRIENLKSELGLDSHVIMTGFVSNEDLTDYYKLSDIFLMPSKGEGFGIVFLEALACGKTIIVGSKDASREAVLDGEIGLIIDPDNIEQLEDTIIDALNGNIRDEFKDGNYLRTRALQEFGFDKYKERLKNYVLSHQYN